MLDFLINDFLQKRKAQQWQVASISISSDTELKANECLFIESFAGPCRYFSASDYFDSNGGNRITQNLGHLHFLGTPAPLTGYKVSITAYQVATANTTNKKIRIENNILI